VDSAVLMEGETLHFSIEVTDSTGAALTDRDVLLYSMNPKVASVTQARVVEARSRGRALIVARSEGVRDTARVDVRILFRTISAGAAHTCGISAARRTYCWGEGSMGRLGAGNDRSSTVPMLVDAPRVLSSLSAGGESTCGVNGSAAYCWGSNNARQLGTGGKYDSWVPVPVTGGHRFRTVELGTVHACGITIAGTAMCWGSDWGGQVGNGPRPRTFEPDTVAGGLAFVSIAAGWSFSCGVTIDGTPYCWGYNELHQLGTASADENCRTRVGGDRPCSTDPIAVSTGEHFTSVVAGGLHACGLATDGRAYCWGDNAWGQRGDGTTDRAPAPTAVLGGQPFVGLTAGERHTCGLTAEGHAYCWGDNSRGALGATHTAPDCGGAPCSLIPVRAAAPLVFDVLSASTGREGSHTCGVTPTGHAYCWGRNDVGQLGAGVSSGAGIQPRLVWGQPEP
jgi:alpha-tubulin suppressor-like RCC1 family protein